MVPQSCGTMAPERPPDCAPNPLILLVEKKMAEGALLSQVK